MRRDDIIKNLLAMRAMLDETLEAVRAVEDAPARPEQTYMRIEDFCRRWDISRREFHTRVGEGLPTVGEGRGRRVKVTDGDEWMMGRRTGKAVAHG